MKITKVKATKPKANVHLPQIIEYPSFSIHLNLVPKVFGQTFFIKKQEQGIQYIVVPTRFLFIRNVFVQELLVPIVLSKSKLSTLQKI